MRRTDLLQEIRKMRFEEAYSDWNEGRLTQAEAAQILGMGERNFRRYVARFEADGMDGLIAPPPNKTTGAASHRIHQRSYSIE